jgi:mRNA-degrading endonuclease RelE of RelBE toxin-antitoxin system
LSRDVRYVRRAIRELEAIHEPDRSKIVALIQSFSRNGKADVKKLRGADDIFRLRFGRWRVVLSMTEEEIIVLRITDRKDAYR